MTTPERTNPIRWTPETPSWAIPILTDRRGVIHHESFTATHPNDNEFIAKVQRSGFFGKFTGARCPCWRFFIQGKILSDYDKTLFRSKRQALRAAEIRLFSIYNQYTAL